MEVNEQIKVFKEFIETIYEVQLLESVRKGKNYLFLDFNELTKFNPELADELLEAPEEILKAGELAIKEFDLPKKIDHFYLRFFNLTLIDRAWALSPSISARRMMSAASRRKAFCE
jgi:DNA replicative helicase MCM subunit Mcm2 (Cdc46/Mcm family)